MQESLVRAPARDEKRSISVWLCIHVISACVGIGLFFAIGPKPNNVPCTGADQVQQGYMGCLSWGQMFGVVFIIIMLFVYLWAGENLVFSAARLSQWGMRQHKQAVILLVLAFLLSLSLCVVSWVKLMKPESTYQLESDGSLKHRDKWNIDALEVVLGGLIFASLIPFCCALLLVLRNTLSVRLGSHGDVPLSPITSSTTKPPAPPHFERRYPVVQLLLSLFVLAMCFLLTMTLGPIWNFTLTYYLTLVSPFSLVFWPVGGTLPKCTGPNSTCACVFPEPNSLVGSACWFSFKIYSDTLLFYSTIVGVILLGALLHKKRQRVRLPDRRCSRLTLLELGLYVVVSTLFLIWLLYWSLWYGRFHDLDVPHDCAYDWDGGVHNPDDTVGPCPADTKGWSLKTIGNLHVLCRASGHMGSLAFALTLLPVGKHSPLLAAMGVSWERALHWHRGLGQISWLCVFTHFLLWVIKWAHDGTLWKNTFLLDTQAWLWVTPVWNHFENWSVAMMMIAFIVFTIVTGLSYFIRRKNYRLFYVTHSFMLVFVALAIVHAWSFWYFVIPGLVLWWLDRLWRMVLASKPVSVSKIEFAIESDKLGSELVLVELVAPHLSANFYPGQYCFLHIPSVSRSEWHPFTMNVIKGSVVFLIKGMTAQGWTHRLKSQIREGGDTASTLPVGLLTMGPYGGIPPEFLRAEKALLVAGGIGITPVLATYQTCLEIESIKWLTLVWVVREASLLTFPLIMDVLARRREGVEVLIYLTDREITPLSIQIVRGRPQLRKIFGEFAAKQGRRSWSFACGPMCLQQEVEGLSADFDFECHVETFLF